MPWTPLPDVVETLVETPTPKEFTLDPAKTAVVIVDMQNNFCMKGNQRAYDVIEGNVRLLAKAREAGAKVIYVQSVRWPESPNWRAACRHSPASTSGGKPAGTEASQVENAT